MERFNKFKNIIFLTMINGKKLNDTLYWISLISFVIGIILISANQFKILGIYVLSVGIFAFVVWTIMKMIQPG